MKTPLGRRLLLGLVTTGALAPVLAACGGKHDREKGAPVVRSAGGTSPDMVMIIRHAEKPEGSGAPYGITADGEQDEKSLIVRGWTRAGALVQLFDPRDAEAEAVAPRAGITRPATIFAADPGKHGSKRPLETVTPLAQALGLQVDQRFAKGQEQQLAAALATAHGPVLIGWEHESIEAIIEQMGTITPAPPKDWPGDRFDIVYVFTRAGDGWNFTQVPQMLLSGDATTPIS